MKKNARGYDPKAKGVLYTDDLAKLLGIMSPDTFEERLIDSGADDESVVEGYRNYKNALENVADHVFGEHGLVLTERKSGGYKIEPIESWRDAAAKIVHTINGVGMFHFSSVKEFLDSGPYTAREAVLSHLGYLKRRSEVYGEPSPQRMFESAMR